MDWPSESFAKTATKHRFQELINSRPSSAIVNRLPSNHDDSHELINNNDGDELSYRRVLEGKGLQGIRRERTGTIDDGRGQRSSGDGPRRLSTDATAAAQRLRARADNIRKVLDETADFEDAMRPRDENTIRRPRRNRPDKGVTNFKILSNLLYVMKHKTHGQEVGIINRTLPLQKQMKIFPQKLNSSWYTMIYYNEKWQLWSFGHWFLSSWIKTHTFLTFFDFLQCAMFIQTRK